MAISNGLVSILAVPPANIEQNILWKNPVHEVLTGYKEHTYLPAEEEFCFYHPKNINKQEKQNKFYEGI